jgi:hypothetical protein
MVSTGEAQFAQSECEICEGSCYRDSLHRLSPLAVLIDRMEWPHTHGRIKLVEGVNRPWIARLSNKCPITAEDPSYWFYGDTRSTALRQAVAACLEEDAPSDELADDPLASLLDSLPPWTPWNEIVLRRDQLHIYVYIGKHFGGHGLAEALYNMIRLTKEATDA